MSADYIEVNVPATEEESQVLVAQLSELGFESFVEEDDTLLAYIKADSFTEALLGGIAAFAHKINYKRIPAQNWNQAWESNFEPILIGDHLYVRASHHAPHLSTEEGFIELVIEPKMSFGTGHHATTSSMCELMLEADKENSFQGKTVIDAGSGTGILAILAEKLGAADVFAFDHEDWAVENARENAAVNSCTRTRVELEDLTTMQPLQEADVVLANITRNMILGHLDLLTRPLAHGGDFYCSGFVVEDLPLIEAPLLERGFHLAASKELKNWCAARFVKA